MVLFTRLSALAGREDNVEKYFEYELTPYPMSLFKDGFMRKPDKASLRNVLLTNTSDSLTCEKTVIDGGALLHRVYWPQGISYKELLSLYVSTVREAYGSSHVVFDGYRRASVKDHEHARRIVRSKSKYIMFTLNMKVTIKHEEFLSNKNNKIVLIEKSANVLVDDGQAVTLSFSDADKDIVKVAIQVKQFTLCVDI